MSFCLIEFNLIQPPNHIHISMLVRWRIFDVPLGGWDVVIIESLGSHISHCPHSGFLRATPKLRMRLDQSSY